MKRLRPRALPAVLSFAAIVALCAATLPAQKVATVHDALKPVPRAGRWMKRHEAMNERVRKGNVDLVFIGDSITQGWEGRGKTVWAKHYGKRSAVNLGIGGDRTQHVLWRLDNGNLQEISPKLAVVMIGTNNSGSNSPEQIAEGITAIVHKIRSSTPDTKVLLLAVFPRGTDSADKRRKVNEATNAIVKKLDDGQHVFYLDIGAKFLNDEGVLTREIMPDLLHLSEPGYEIWADSIEPHVAKLMGDAN